MIKSIFIETIKRSGLSSTIFAATELFGGLYLAFLVSAFASTGIIQDKNLTTTYIFLGLIFFLTRSFLSVLSIRMMLKTSFEISRRIILNNFNAVFNVDSSNEIDTDLFKKYLARSFESPIKWYYSNYISFK